MTDLETSLSDSEFITEVRNSLAGLDTTQIPDDTITQTRDRFVEPLLNDSSVVFQQEDQDAFDNASIVWTAELAFKAWMTYTRLRDAEVEAYVDPSRYQSNLESRTDQSLGILGVTRPPDVPNQVISVSHDGEHRAVNLDKNWTVEVYGSEG